MASDIAQKLNLKEGMKVRVTGKPANVELTGVSVSNAPKSGGVIVFVKTLADVDSKCASVIEAARDDRIAWIAYPKAGQLGTDLNRDILWNHLLKQNIQGIRQIAIDDVWSAMRFRPNK